MNTLEDLAERLSSACDKSDLMRLRSMSATDFETLLFLHRAELAADARVFAAIMGRQA